MKLPANWQPGDVNLEDKWDFLGLDTTRERRITGMGGMGGMGKYRRPDQMLLKGCEDK